MWHQFNKFIKIIKWNTLRHSAATLAIDLSESSIKLLEITPSATGPMMTHCAMKNISAGLVHQGNIRNIPALAEEIATLLPLIHARQYFVRLAIEDEWVIKRLWTVSAQVRSHELPELIRMEAGKWVNFPAEELYFDYQILKQEHLSDEHSILVVVCHSLLILSRRHLFESLGMTVQSIEIASTALERMPQELGPWRLVFALAKGRE